MQIRVDAANDVSLAEPDDFRDFAVVLDRPLTDDMAAALARLGRFDGEHVFVEPSWLTDHAGARADDPSWRKGFDGMVGYASSKGWVDDDGRVRAHVRAGS